MLHVLPSGFMRVRYYGLLANRFRAARLEAYRRLLLVVVVAALLGERPAREPERCPHGGGTIWRVVARVERPTVAEVCRLPLGVDSS